MNSINKPEIDETRKGLGDKDCLCSIQDSSVTLPIEEIEAMCVKIETIPYKWFGQEKLVFHFRVYEPEEYAGTVLKMYVRWNPVWRKRGVPLGAKLWQIIHLAQDGGLKRGQKVQKSVFVGKIFRCRLRTATTTTGIPYSLVDTVTKKLVG